MTSYSPHSRTTIHHKGNTDSRPPRLQCTSLLGVLAVITGVFLYAYMSRSNAEQKSSLQCWRGFGEKTLDKTPRFSYPCQAARK